MTRVSVYDAAHAGSIMNEGQRQINNLLDKLPLSYADKIFLLDMMVFEMKHKALEE